MSFQVFSDAFYSDKVTESGAWSPPRAARPSWHRLGWLGVYCFTVSLLCPLSGSFPKRLPSSLPSHMYQLIQIPAHGMNGHKTQTLLSRIFRELHV